MKKIVCVLVLICVVMGAAFAQQRAPAPAAPAKPAASGASSSGEAKNAVSLDVYRLIEGLAGSSNGVTNINLNFAYERLIVPHYSLGADLDLGILMYSGDSDFSFGLAAEGRYYPNANFDKFFLGATLGFAMTSSYGYSSSGLTTSLKAGYKIKTAKSFFMEPYIAYGIMPGIGGIGAALDSALGDWSSWLDDDYGSSGSSGSSFGTNWQCGLRLGFVF